VQKKGTYKKCFLQFNGVYIFKSGVEIADGVANNREIIAFLLSVHGVMNDE
jgi:hypothetical protein